MPKDNRKLVIHDEDEVKNLPYQAMQLMNWGQATVGIDS